jgi:hypothetical protein
VHESSLVIAFHGESGGSNREGMMLSLGDFLRTFFPVHSREPSARSAADRAASIPMFQPLGLQDFLALEVPPREMLLAPILPERSLSMLYAPRGIGKSWLGLSIGLAVASGGSVLRWNAPRPRRVLFVDGEMVLSDLQIRLNSILAGLGTKIPNDGFRVLAADDSELGINLGSPEGQRELERHLDGVDLLILDNLSTLLANGSEGASDAWLPMQNFLLRLRRKGVAVLLVHHAGVNGRQRGTSRREDALDTVIALRRPGDYGGRCPVRGSHRKSPHAGGRGSIAVRGGGRGVHYRRRATGHSLGGRRPEAAGFPAGGRTLRPRDECPGGEESPRDFPR